MIGRSTWTLLVGAVMLASAGSAAALTGHDGVGDLFNGGHFDSRAFDEGDIDRDNFLDADGVFNTADHLGDCNGNELTGVADVDRKARVVQSSDQKIQVDDDDILLGIALANNGAHGISWNALRDITRTEEASRTASIRADLEREDVFSALALGVNAHGGALDALVCISDVEFEESVKRTVSRWVNLDEDEVLLAIALENSIGGGLDFEDIADIKESDVLEVEDSRRVDVEREDAFLALALGAGG